MSRKKISAVAVLAILAVAAVAAFAAVLCTLTIPSQWGVQLAYGLQFSFANGTLTTPTTGLNWGLVPAYGSETVSFNIARGLLA
jgi:hypothetical protein